MNGREQIIVDFTQAGGPRDYVGQGAFRSVASVPEKFGISQRLQQAARIEIRASNYIYIYIYIFSVWLQVQEIGWLLSDAH